MIVVLRLGHRLFRDKRITTHCALIARAFGADKLIYSGEHDAKLESSVKKVAEKWGGNFKIEYAKKPFKAIKDFKGKTIHLTMYGIPYKKKLRKIKKQKNLLIIIGGEKVPREIYKLADYNIAVGNTPHSEIAALVILLNEISGIKEFKDAKLKIIPREHGKKIVKVDK